jgi:hypothetical protein
MNDILIKIKFFFDKPKAVIVAGQRRKKAKEMILRVLSQHFKINKDIFVFETEEIDKLSFYIKHSKMPILADDEKIIAADETLKFGFDEKNDVFASDIKLNGGINFKVNYKGAFVPFWTASSADTDYQEQIYPVLSAVCVGTVFGLNLVEISQLLK